MARTTHRPRRSRRSQWLRPTGAVAALALAAGALAGGGLAIAPAAAGDDAVADAEARVAEATDRLADAQDELASVEADVADAEARATEAAQRLTDAEARHAELTARIVDLEAQIDLTQEAVDALRPIVQARAVAAYQGAELVPVDMFGADDLLDAARGARLLGSAKAAEDATLDDLAQAQEDLDDRQASLERDREELDGVLATLAEAQAEIMDELTAATEALDAAQSTVDARAAALAEAQEDLEDAQAAEARERAAALPATRDTSGSSSSGSAGRPSRGGDGASASILCPIEGPVAFVDTYGEWRPDGRTHEGIDIFSPPAAKNVAVVSGTVTQGIGENQGNGVFLYGDDGNSYWYFHLARFAGPPGRVERGEVIGYTGDTGNSPSGAYHTHFEFHPGHGGPANPYDIVAAAC